MLQSLEHTRSHLEAYFPRTPAEITFVLHGGPGGLIASNPLMPLVWLATAPAARRYVVGWAGRSVIHMLEPALLRGRASKVAGSAEMLELGAACLYARRVVIASNKDLARVMPALRLRRELRWAWLLEGAARWFGGQTAHARPAIARRLRESSRAELPARPARCRPAGRDRHRSPGARAGERRPPPASPAACTPRARGPRCRRRSADDRWRKPRGRGARTSRGWRRRRQ